MHANAAGEGGKACTMLVRTLHWVVPSYSIWGLPFFLFYSTRLAQFLYERPNQGLLRSMLCTLMKPLVCTCIRACVQHNIFATVTFY
jgi:dimethylaniline monooxygenase (N-oxide forming)